MVVVVVADTGVRGTVEVDGKCEGSEVFEETIVETGPDVAVVVVVIMDAVIDDDNDDDGCCAVSSVGAMIFPRTVIRIDVCEKEG